MDARTCSQAAHRLPGAILGTPLSGLSAASVAVGVVVAVLLDVAVGEGTAAGLWSPVPAAVGAPAQVGRESM